MIKNINKAKNRKHFLLVFLLVITSGSANSISYGGGVMSVISVFMIGYIFFLKKGKLLSNLFIPLSIVFLYFIGYIVKFDTLDFGFLARFVSYVTIPYCILLLIGKERFFEIYVKVMVFLAIVAFPFYLYQLLDPFGLFNLLKPIESFFMLGKFDGTASATTGNNYVNVVFYTLNTTYTDIFHRSAGFAFEPGFYSIFIVLAIFFNIVITKKLFNKSGLILLIALVTTFSTTGFIAFMVILIYYFMSGSSKSSYLKYLLPILLSLLVITFFSVSFLSNKILDSYQGLGQMELSEIGRNQNFTAGRFLGFKVAMLNFQINPLIGYGDYGDGEYFKKNLNSNVGIINGIGNYIATLGAFGVLFLLIAFKKTYRQIKHLLGNVMMFLSFILLVVSFSFAFPLTTLFGVFMVYSFVPSSYNVKKS